MVHLKRIKINILIVTLLFSFVTPIYASATTIKNLQNYSIVNGITIKQTEKLIKRIDEIKQIIPNNVSDAEIALSIYDYVASNVQYDLYKYDNTAFGALKKRKAKCVGYAMAVRQLLLEYDIPNVILFSKKANHVWNAVKINNKWYHLDATWGSTGRTGNVNHKYFLISTSKLLDLDPRRVDAKIYDTYADNSFKMPDSSYSKNAFWKKTESVSYYYKHNWYFVSKRSGKIKKYNFKTGKIVPIYDKKHVWYTDDKNRYYTDNFITLAGYKNKLYFNTPTSIQRINLDNKKVKTICKIKKKDKKLYGLTKDSKHSIVIGFSNKPEDNSYRVYVYKIKNIKKRLDKLKI